MRAIEYRAAMPVAEVEFPSHCGAVVTVLGAEYSCHDFVEDAIEAADAINRNTIDMPEHLIRHHYRVPWPIAK
jgi:hypothetical protein